MSRQRTRTLTRGEVGLAEFHRIIGYSSALAALCLMMASVTALYWFAGVIGLPVIAQVAVALAIEVMAASLAASATTAYRDGGKVDYSAWVGFAFFISIAAFANIMHVVTYLDTSVAPPWFGQGAFIIASCIFAAACPLGGTWGVHRFGWLRAHGADAQWTEDAHGNVVAPAPVKPAPRPAKRPAPSPAAAPVAPPTAPAPAAAPAPTRAPGTRPAGDMQAAAREVYDRMVTETPGVKPTASVIATEVGYDGHPATPRRWVQGWWNEDPRNPENVAAGAKAELHLADPESNDDDLIVTANRGVSDTKETRSA